MESQPLHISSSPWQERIFVPDGLLGKLSTATMQLASQHHRGQTRRCRYIWLDPIFSTGRRGASCSANVSSARGTSRGLARLVEMVCADARLAVPMGPPQCHKCAMQLQGRGLGFFCTECRSRSASPPGPARGR
jgi:hypothetical protein